jgi:hypothetical protein
MRDVENEGLNRRKVLECMTWVGTGAAVRLRRMSVPTSLWVPRAYRGDHSFGNRTRTNPRSKRMLVRIEREMKR